MRIILGKCFGKVVGALITRAFAREPTWRMTGHYLCVLEARQRVVARWAGYRCEKCRAPREIPPLLSFSLPLGRAKVSATIWQCIRRCWGWGLKLLTLDKLSRKVVCNIQKFGSFWSRNFNVLLESGHSKTISDSF